MAKKYQMYIVETLSKGVIVEADSLEEAERKVWDMYDECEIVLDYKDFDEVEVKFSHKWEN